MKPKIFIYDIETSPILVNTWSLWSEAKNFDNVVQDWCMLTWAGKWLGKDKVSSASNHPSDPTYDADTVSKLHAFIDEADIVVAHNGNRFDIKKMNARFLLTGMSPPSPYRKIDTLLEARKNFALTSNRLDALGKMLGLGEKMETGGFKLWLDFLAGCKKANREMVKYNKQDVLLLEEVYLALRPWMQNHPNLGVFADEPVCPKCSSTDVSWRGYATTQAGRYHRFQCNSCGGWGRSKDNVVPKEVRKGMNRNVQ